LKSILNQSVTEYIFEPTYPPPPERKPREAGEKRLNIRLGVLFGWPARGENAAKLVDIKLTPKADRQAT
jgi:hypothetical protein